MSAKLRALGLVAALVAVAGTAEAGGPLVTTTNGLPVGWDASAPVQYYTDLGGLGSMSNGTAVATVGALFDAWTDVSSAVISYQRVGSTAVDVDASNYGPFLGPYGGATAPLGRSVIVFDDDGAIFDALYGVGTGVLGFAGPVWMSDGVTTVPIGAAVPPGAKIIEGLAFLNGKWIDGINDPPNGNYELALGDFEAVFVHEFGHFSGLDHTQVHALALPADSDAPGVTSPIETMYPFLYGASQKTLERDDVVALSVLYPTATFASTTGRITGRVLTSNGAPLSGANVVAHNVADDSDSISYVSGATIVPPGTYSIAGLTPGASYRVEVQEVDSVNTGGSRVGPFSPPIVLPGPPEAYNGLAESADPAVDDPTAATPIVAAAGVTASGIDVTLNYQSFAVNNVPVEEGSQLVSFAVADYDGDSATDFVAPQFGFVPGNMTRFYRGVGDGTFDAPVTIEAFPGNEFAVAGQFNPGVDAFPDVAVLSSTLLDVRVYFGDGTGGFAAPVTALDLSNPGFAKTTVGLAGGDLNGDGRTDLVTLVVDYSDDSAVAYALLGSAGGTFSVVSTPFASGSPFPHGAIRTAQLAGGPQLDVVGWLSDTALSVLTGDGAGGFTASALSLGAFTVWFGGSFDVGDFDEDGLTDLAIADFHPVGGPTNYTRTFVDVLLNDGVGGFTLSAQYFVAESFQWSLVAADVDGDTHLDVASVGSWFGASRPGAKVTIARGDGTGAMSAPEEVWGIAEYPQLLTAAELNGDGRLDFLVGSYSSLYSVMLQEHCGNGTTESPEQCDDGNRTHGDGCDGNCTSTGCGNGVVSAGEACDDGNVSPGDGCSATCTVEAVCGDGIVAPSEQCDDGNALNGDCCSSTCTFEALGASCGTPANLCYAAACNGAGACQTVPRPPRPCRASTAPRAGRLQLKSRSDAAKNRLDWKWGKGVTTPKAAFGAPESTTGYAFCVYDVHDALLMSAAIPAGTLCNPSNPRPCWKSTANGLKYADPALTADGVSRIVLTQGLQDGKAKIVVGGKGAALDMPALPIAPSALPLRAQLEAANGECWVATYGTFISNDTGENFSAKSD